MVGPTGAATVNTYDDLGNKIGSLDPDLGLWLYEYRSGLSASFGRLMRRARWQTWSMIWQDDRPGAQQRTCRLFGFMMPQHMASGKVCSIINSNGYREDYYYDAFGRANATAVQIDPETVFHEHRT